MKGLQITEGIIFGDKNIGRHVGRVVDRRPRSGAKGTRRFVAAQHINVAVRVHRHAAGVVAFEAPAGHGPKDIAAVVQFGQEHLEFTFHAQPT